MNGGEIHRLTLAGNKMPIGGQTEYGGERVSRIKT